MNQIKEVLEEKGIKQTWLTNKLGIQKVSFECRGSGVYRKYD